MKQILYIFMGGGIGSILRFLLANFVQKSSGSAFPFGTFLVNIFGCFIIGVLSGIFLKNESDLKFLLITGFCGGFTTFSTFSAENISLWQSGNYGLLALNVILSVFIGLAAVFLGLKLSS